MLECNSEELGALHCCGYAEFLTGSCIHHPDTTEKILCIVASERDETQTG